jgi:uncharacterized protein (DUF736 family)
VTARVWCSLFLTPAWQDIPHSGDEYLFVSLIDPTFDLFTDCQGKFFKSKNTFQGLYQKERS